MKHQLLLLSALVFCAGWTKNDHFQKIGTVAGESEVIYKLDLNPNESFFIAVDFDPSENIACSLTDSKLNVIAPNSSKKAGVCQFSGKMLDRDIPVFARVINLEKHDVEYSIVAK